MIADGKILISVIVPVYNAKEYLGKSVNSILSQTYPNIELILVDDGSDDGSGEICDSLAQNDCRIKVIHKENGGQSEARNYGLDIASGEYIGFVDSDDTISPHMFETLLFNMLREKAQISCCGTELLYPDGKVDHFNRDTSLYQAYTKNEALIEFTNNSIITASLWDKLYHRDVFEGLRLRKGIIYEDFQIMPYCLLNSDRVVYTGEPLYCYNVTSFSSLRGHRSLKLYDIVPVCTELVELYSKVCPEGVPGIDNQLVDHCLTLFYISYNDPAWTEKREEILSILSNINKKRLACLYPDNRIKVGIIRMNPAFYVSIYSFFQNLKALINKL